MKKLFLSLLCCPLFAAAQDSLQAYNNYDFIPGDTILFEDHFRSDQPGEFPVHWELVNGQAVMNHVDGITSLLMTDGNYCTVKPRMKAKTYLGDRFSIEFDTHPTHNAYGIIVFMRDLKGNKMNVSITSDKAIWSYSNTKTMAGKFPAELLTEKFYNNWHHIAMAYKMNQLKIYVDQYRVLTVPDCGLSPATMDYDGIGNLKNPIVFSNVKIAEGADMFIAGQRFTAAKIVTHGINFDVNKSTIRPESMGTLNNIVQLMKDNPDIKFEVGGHTDSDGDDASNMTLSKQRADAVKSQLIVMGIDAARLTAKGYGESKPISPNTTDEGKTNNRRVEFVKN
ncbi:MAG TPA: OmpA family protein [Chitinophagaceae bacterium]|nr:OmpA family protein [Chitinophagaceae bacterium]